MAKTRKTRKPEVDNSDGVALKKCLGRILELCGLTGGEITRQDADSRDTACRLIDEIVRYLETLEVARGEGTFDGSAVSIETAILKLEVAICDLRAHVKEILDVTRQTPHGLHLCSELELLCVYGRFTSLRLLARSMKGSLRRLQWKTREVSLKVHEHLGQIHLPSARGDLIPNLRLCSLALRQLCTDPRKSPWREALQVFSESNYAELVGDMPHANGPSQDVRNRVVCIAGKQKQTKASLATRTILSSNTIQEAIREFNKRDDLVPGQNILLLLLGPHGSGKTFTCNQIEAASPSCCEVIRPSLPFDVLGPKLGAAEDLLISIFAHAMTADRRTILVLDNIDCICGSGGRDDASSGGYGETYGKEENHRGSHVPLRLQSAFYSFMELLTERPATGNGLLVVCTSRARIGSAPICFDKVYFTRPPSADTRRLLLAQLAGLNKRTGGQAVGNLQVPARLSSMVSATTGLSHAELVHRCRQAVWKARAKGRGEQYADTFFGVLSRQIQSAIPESISAGVSADFVDMTVTSAQELVATYHTSYAGSSNQAPLFGESPKAAWEILKRLVVVPLCSTKQLTPILCHQGGAVGGSFAGGVLIAGPPGCGKSTMAFHAASLAAATNPSIQLIDVNCTSLVKKEVGGSELSVRRLFRMARDAAPCIMVLEGVENVAAVRGNDNTTEGTMERVLSTLMTEFDDLNENDNRKGLLAIIGITQDPRWIDPALLRPGRLGELVEVDLPEQDARKEISKQQLGEVRCNPDRDALATLVAASTAGFSGAGIRAVCNEARLHAAHTEHSSGSVQITSSHILRAIESQRFLG